MTVRKDLIQRKISLIQDDLEALSKLEKYSIEEIVSDFVRQAALERILERIITRAIDINEHLIAELSKADISSPKDYRETFLRLTDLKIYPAEFAQNIAKSVGTRNLLVHQYDEIDYGKIYHSVKDCLKDYGKYIDYILKIIEKN